MDNTQEVIYENTSTSNYKELSNIVSRPQEEIVKNAILTIGYFLFAVISLHSIQHTYLEPITLLKNVLFSIAFSGISYTYGENTVKSYKGDVDIKNQIYSINNLVIFNICAVLYGLLCIFYNDSRYQMNSFFRSTVKKPTLFGIEIDGLFAFIAHSLLLLPVIINNTGYMISTIVSLIFIVSYILSFSYNLNINHMKNKWLYYIISLGSLLLITGYIYDIVLIVKDMLS